MKIALTSIVRNGIGYLDRYAQQVDSLARALYLSREDDLTVYIAEGDSTDGTWEWLQSWHQDRRVGDFSVKMIKADHGGPVFGSVDDSIRWRNIARTWNKLYRFVGIDRPDATIYIEADLVWDAETMLKLLSHLERVPAVAPMSMYHSTSGIFYDTWGHRGLDGVHFEPYPPYHSSLEGQGDRLVQISSAGSCKVLRGGIVGQCWFSEVDAMLGHDLYAKGFSLWLDPSSYVVHP